MANRRSIELTMVSCRAMISAGRIDSTRRLWAESARPSDESKFARPQSRGAADSVLHTGESQGLGTGAAGFPDCVNTGATFGGSCVRLRSCGGNSYRHRSRGGGKEIEISWASELSHSVSDERIRFYS